MRYIVRAIDEAGFEVGCELNDITKAEAAGEQVIGKFRTVLVDACRKKGMNFHQAFQIDGVLGEHGPASDVAATKAAHG